MWEKVYGETEGPLGFPMKATTARNLEVILKALPKQKEYEYRKHVIAKAPTELNPGERSDVSWITTEAVDRYGEVVLSRGLNITQFAANPLVTLNHAYYIPAVGRSLWQKRVKDGEMVGIKAKTKYPEKPEGWPEKEAWIPDRVFGLVQAQLLAGKSIGFLPTKMHYADDREQKKRGWPDGTLVFDESILLEYACCSLPVNQETLVEQVSKAGPLDERMAKALGINLGIIEKDKRKDDTLPVIPSAIAFYGLDQIEAAMKAGLEQARLEEVMKQRVADAFDRRRGAV